VWGPCDDVKLVRCEYENLQRALISDIEGQLMQLAELLPRVDVLKFHEMTLDSEVYSAIEVVRRHLSENSLSDCFVAYEEARLLERREEEFEFLAAEMDVEGFVDGNENVFGNSGSPMQIASDNE
jgi:hypothetical protein